MISQRPSLRRDQLAFDTVLALALAALSVITILAGARDVGSYDPVSIVLLFTQSLPLVLRRAFPLSVLGVTLAATLVHAYLAQDNLSSGVGSLIALFTVGESYPRRTSIVAALVMGGSLAVLIAARGGVPESLGSLVQTMLSVLAVWTLGAWSRERQAYIGVVEERASSAERGREEEARRAVTEERERIARELHDVVAHHVSVIVIQAGAAGRALYRRPEEARSALAAIEATGRQALAEMRRMLGALGPVAGSVPEASDAPAPMPGLDRLGELIESVRAAGLPVELTVDGDRRDLEPGVELTAYRIIQEALTNTLKHAQGARAQVAIRYQPETLELAVSDQGGVGSREMAPSDGLGHGLIGMRERVAIFGGELEAGPTGGGFRIVARLPVGATES